MSLSSPETKAPLRASDAGRRRFLQRAVTLAGGALLGCHATTKPEPMEPLTFDLHAHPGLFFARDVGAFPVGSMTARTLADMKTARYTGAFFSLVADLKLLHIGPAGIKPVRDFGPDEAWSEYKRQVGLFRELVQAYGLLPATTAADLERAWRRQEIAAFLACEGGDFLEGDAGRLDEMQADGVRSVTLVHYHPNELGDLQTSAPRHDGLSAAGKAVVRRMNRLKLVIDVSHATFETTRDVAALSSAPIMLSHGILKADGPRPLAERAVSVEHARLVASTGGVIGVWPSGYNASFDEFVQATARMIDAVGIDHVGLGTDMDGNFRPVLDRYSQAARWLDGLKSYGLDDEEVRKVGGGNARRLLQTVL